MVKGDNDADGWRRIYAAQKDARKDGRYINKKFHVQVEASGSLEGTYEYNTGGTYDGCRRWECRPDTWRNVYGSDVEKKNTRRDQTYEEGVYWVWPIRSAPIPTVRLQSL